MNDVIATMMVQNNVFESLVRYGENNRLLEPNLAESWNTEGAGKIWRFKLRKGVTFHDGSPLTADEVVNSIRRSPFFKGSIEKAGSMIVRFVFTEKRVNFLKALTKVSLSIAKTGEGDELLGTGPFILENWDGSDKISMRAFRSYWGKNPSIDGVTFHCHTGPEKSLYLMRKGEIDITHVIPPSMVGELKSDDRIALSVLEGTSTCYIHINTRRPPLDNSEFRHAINMLINREEIIRDIYFGQALECRQVVPPVIGKRETGPSRVKYRPVKARKIIKKYLSDQDRVFKMIGLPFSRPYCPDPDSLARLVTGYLEEGGLKIDYIRTDSWNEWLERATGDDCDFVVSGWVLDSRSLDDFYTDLFGIDGVVIPLGGIWENEDFRYFIEEARKTISVRKQWQFYDRAEEEFFKEYPWIILVHPNRLSAYRKGISGLWFSPIAEFWLGEVDMD